MKTLRLFMLVSFVSISNPTLSQVEGFRHDNILLPDHLLFSDHIGFDAFYKHSNDSTNQSLPIKPFFDIVIQGDYLKALVDKVLEGKIAVFDPNENESFPYGDLKQPQPLTADEIKRRFGQRVDTVMQMNDDGTTRILVNKSELRIDQISSINFVDEWILTVNPFHFVKKVLAIEPVRKYGDEFGEGDHYIKTFRLYCSPSETTSQKKLKPIANIRYEYFFDIDNVYRTDDFATMIGYYMQHLEEGYPTNQFPSNITSPFFNAINQKIFIQTLIDNATMGTMPIEDYLSKKRLSPEEVKERLFEKIKVIITNYDGNPEEREVENDYGSQIRSVVFSEEWFYNEETLSIQKKVVGIAPVRYYNEWFGEQSVVKRQILFNVILN